MAELLALLAEKDRQLDERNELLTCTQKALTDSNKSFHSQQRYIAILEEKLRLATIRKFAASSEKVSFQGELFDEAELEAALGELDAELIEEETITRRKRKKPNRGFAASLPRERVDLRLSEADKAGADKTFFVKVKEELDIIPAQVRVLEYWQEKAVFTTSGKQRMIAAQRQAHPLGKCAASTSLLAHIIIAKYCDSLPLYRLEGILDRYGGSMTRTAMANWVIRLEAVFRPVLNLLKEVQLEADYLQADETRLQVLKETGKVATSDKWMWVVRGGPPDKPVVLFEYDPSRSGAVASRLLDGFEGVLQADGYGGYNAICHTDTVTRIGCMDHARRKFVEASKAGATNKKAAKGKPSKADVALSKIRKLYRIEEQIKDLSVEEKTTKRQSLSTPILDELKAWLDKNITRIAKDGLTWKAMNYMLNQWDYLIGYCRDGKLHISNALAENAIRPFAVGRRNWLFSDTSRGARASAACYTLIQTAKENGLEPHGYIKYLLDHIASADTVEKLEALLPWNVK